jgi:hypothetical protein
MKAVTKKKKAPTSRKATAPVRKPAPQKSPPAQPPDPLADMQTTLRQVEAAVNRLAAPPASVSATLETGVDSVRRLLSEIMEKQAETLLVRLVQLHALAAQAAGTPAAVTEHLEALIKDLGAVRFEAQRADYLDPLIHVVVSERREASLPEGVILETLRPGYRTGRGIVLAKASVVINRRG